MRRSRSARPEKTAGHPLSGKGRPKEARPQEDQAPSDRPPVPIDLTIERVAYGGAGVGRTDGLVMFVPGTIPGETVSVQPVRLQKRFCEAELLEIKKASPLRQGPVCKLFGRCGGCAYQHVPYPTQLEWKTVQVRELLERIGKIENPPVAPAVPSPQHLGYRNRIRIHVAKQEGSLRVGFYERRGRRIVEVHDCPIASTAVNQKLAALRNSLPVPGEFTLSERPDVLFFEQTNDGAAAALVGVVESLVGIKHELLVDAYCGAGFFGNLLAPHFARVAGIESNSKAVDAALRKAPSNASYQCGDVSELLAGILSDANPALTTVLLDPPAAGVSPKTLEILSRVPVAKLLYVSCDPGTQARDLGVLVRSGYRLETVVPVDMFPQTGDIEVVAALSGGEKNAPLNFCEKNHAPPKIA